MTKLVVIGGVAAGMSAASKARRTNQGMEIEVYTDEEYISYAGCGLPYFVAGMVQEERKLIARTKEQFVRQGIKVFTNHKVLSILPTEMQIIVVDSEGAEKKVNYDKLVIATGARAFVPPLPGKELDNVFTVKSIPSARRIKEQMQSEQVKNIVIVGGGYIGLEMAEAFAAWKKQITIVELAPQLLGNIDEDMAALVEEYLVKEGVQIRKGEKVLALEGQDQVRKVVTDKGEIPADLVILAIGIQPNSELAAEAGIQLGVKKAIKVNKYMETNIPNIYAAGDCATAYHLLYQDDAYIPLGTTANKQGKVAGENAAGGKAEFAGIVGTAIIKVLDLEIGRTGLSKREAQQLGREVQEIKVEAYTKAHFYPGSQAATIKLLIEKASQKIVGAQIVGGAGAGKRIDVLAVAVQLGLTPFALSELDLSYAPPFSPVWDPVLTVANVAVGELEKKA
ncbi:CoA-disulfide reductase [Thermanaerosceptrum fracticalcis]|uniref:CoA-disulfide reductase n=1 Tax=Thermanaerosceptrum fracticalcis TaxID=1712410 RepID=A0A7G6E3B4_THEFR|nr:CoA-disulfide reductase [Thermanaerosceptrum fracticalcis]QNB46568.1 CoA-disulfide reductase [Thermanaerosceptrum fracticalcis]